MKKLISLVLTMIMIFSCVITASAYTPIDPDSDYAKYIKELEAEHIVLLSDYITEQTGTDTKVSVNYLLSGEIDNKDYYLFSFHTDADVEKEYSYRMSVYAFYGKIEHPVFREGFAVYTVADEQWHSLDYLYGRDDWGLTELCNIDRWEQTGSFNDFNFIVHFAIDGSYPNIVYATVIQKHLAGLNSNEIPEDCVKYLDIDNDGEVTIKDATTLQKYLAGLEIEVYDSIV